MNWPKEDLLLQRTPHATRTHILAAYNIDLAMGHSIKGKPIDVSTMKGYTNAAAAMIAKAVDRDPRFTEIIDSKMSTSLHAIWDECLRYQKMPNKADPYSPEMHATLAQLNVDANSSFDGLFCAMEDWANANTYLGCRISEWAQEDAFKHLSSGGKLSPVPLQHGHLAFTLEDLQCFNRRGAPVSARTFLSDRNSVFKVDVTFSWQKNRNHGETRSLTVNLSNPDRCAVRSFHNILLRFDRLVGIEHTKVPLAVYREGSSSHFLHRTVISRVLRTVAKATYDVSDSELDKHYNFTPHSFRVGACVLLHAAGATAPQIKFLLRWKSDSFMEYLRNVNALSAVQNLAFLPTANASALPNIF